MKANELMIGDWVQGYLPDTFSTIVGVLNAGMVAIRAKRAYIELSIDDIQPIPLTAEILEKNGFVRSSVFVEWKYEEEDIYILWKPFPFLKIETGNVQFNLSGCEYVHELQHALRLCGIDKEIVL